ncbi:MAG: UDP-glucose 4-epimerase GalE [Rhizomicrobium sp.]
MAGNVLVTGGAGYIGSHTCKALKSAGFTPVTYDNLVYGHEWAVKWGPLETGDILDQERLLEVLRRFRPAAVIHFAAFAYVGESVTNPAKYYRNNVVGTLSLLDAMLEAGVPNIVFSSTCATYGIPNTVPITEEEPQAPINPYGASKLMVERILTDYRVAYGLNSVALRYFNAAGADPEGEIGEAHDPETHLIPLVLDTACGKRPQITIFGEDYDTEDGSCVRDFIHVQDLARAHVLAMERLASGTLKPAYNLGTGRGYSVKEVIAAARRATNLAIPIEHGTRRPGDPARLVADASSARADLSWTPALTDIEEIIATAWRWTKEGPVSNRTV